MTRKEVARRLASLYDRRALRSYVRWKVNTDPAYEAVLHQLQNRDEPLIDLGCGVGLLAFYLREHGFRAPIIGVDFDQRKIDVAQKAATRYRGIDFITADARHELPAGYNVVMLDILHYLDARSQQHLLGNVARSAPLAVLRQGIRDASWRYRVTEAVDAFARTVRWMKADTLLFPTRGDVTSAFAGFDAEVTPLWGATPYNNYLFVFRRSA